MYCCRSTSECVLKFGTSHVLPIMVHMEVNNRFLVPVNEISQVGDARRRAARVAQSMGFNETEVGRISIVASELASNLVKHTDSGGSIIVQVQSETVEINLSNQRG